MLAVPSAQARQAAYDIALMLNLTYGIWTFRPRSPLHDRRVYREDRSGCQRQSRFYRAAGVRFRDSAKSGFLDCHGGLIGFSQRFSARVPSALLDGFFGSGLPQRHRMQFRPGCSRNLAGSKGCAILAARHLRRASVPGIADYIGVVRVRREAKVEQQR